MHTIFQPDTRVIVLIDGDNFYKYFSSLSFIRIEQIISTLTTNTSLVAKPILLLTQFNDGFGLRTFPGTSDDSKIDFRLFKDRSYPDIHIFLAALSNLDNFDGLILFADDQDYAPMITYLRVLGKKVLLVHTEGINRVMSDVANFSITLDDYGGAHREKEGRPDAQSRFKVPGELCCELACLTSFAVEAGIPQRRIVTKKVRESILKRERAIEPGVERVLQLIDSDSIMPYFNGLKQTPRQWLMRRKSTGKVVKRAALMSFDEGVYAEEPAGEVLNFRSKLWDDYYLGMDVRYLKQTKPCSPIELLIYLLENLDEFDHLELYSDNPEVAPLIGYLVHKRGKSACLYYRSMDVAECYKLRIPRYKHSPRTWSARRIGRPTT